MALADAVDAADALLDLGRVPGQVEVDQVVGGLEVQALGRGIGADQDVDLAAQEALLDLLALDADQLAGLRVGVLAATAGVGPDQEASGSPA